MAAPTITKTNTDSDDQQNEPSRAAVLAQQMHNAGL